MRYFLFYIFAIFSNGRGSHFEWSVCVKSDINLKQLHLQIILIERDCSTFHKILAFKQNRDRKQEVGHCDLFLVWIFFFILIILKNQDATNAQYKILAKYIK